MKSITKLALVTIGLATLSTNANAASFNCRDASTNIEKAICEDKWLSEKDGEMGRLYHKAMQHANIKYEQRDWVSHRNSNCGANTDCLYDMTEKRIGELKRIIRRGGGSNASHKGSVYSPANGVVCDRKSGFCADSYGISLGLTLDYLGQRDQDIWAKRTRGNFDTSVFTMSNGVFCDTNDGRCYTSKLKDNVDHYFTNKLFR